MKAFFQYQFILLPIVVITYCFSASAQSPTWFLTRGDAGNAQAWGVDLDEQGNIYWATCEIPLFAFYFNITLYKFDQSGGEIWRSKPYGKAFNDYAYNVVVKAPYVYVAGRTDTSANPESANALVLAYDMTNGKLLWEHVWDGGNGYEEVDGIVVANDGIYITGWTQGAAPQMEMDVLLQKLSFDGKLVWSNRWGKSGWDTANGQLVLADTTIYLAGHYNGTGYVSGGDAMLAAFSRKDGVYLWHRTWGGTNYDDAYGMMGSPDGSLYLTGPTVIGFGTQIFILKYSSDGNLLWSALWGGSGGEIARTLATEGDTVMYIGANTESYGAGMNDIAVLKFDSSGNLLNWKTWGGWERDVVSGLTLNKGSIYIAGNTRSFGVKNVDALLLKMNARTMTFPDTTLTSVKNERVTESFSLFQNFPNPFSRSTTIGFRLQAPAHVRLEVFDVLGRKISTLVDEQKETGEHAEILNTGDWKLDLRPGVYFYRLQAGRTILQKKMIVLQ